MHQYTKLNSLHFTLKYSQTLLSQFTVISKRVSMHKIHDSKFTKLEHDEIYFVSTECRNTVDSPQYQQKRPHGLAGLNSI